MKHIFLKLNLLRKVHGGPLCCSGEFIRTKINLFRFMQQDSRYIIKNRFLLVTEITYFEYSVYCASETKYNTKSFRVGSYRYFTINSYSEWPWLSFLKELNYTKFDQKIKPFKFFPFLQVEDKDTEGGIYGTLNFLL